MARSLLLSGSPWVQFVEGDAPGADVLIPALLLALLGVELRHDLPRPPTRR
jgi:hypothetical protein